MKICIVSQTFAPQHEGGAEIVSRSFATELSARHDVVVLSAGMAGTETPPGERLDPGGYRVVRVEFRNSYLPEVRAPALSAATKAIWHFRNHLGAVNEAALFDFFAREAFDLVYCHNAARMQPAVYRAAEQAQIPVCQHLHDYGLMCPRSSMFRSGRNCDRPCLVCRLLTRKVRAASPTVGTAIAVSDFVKRRYQENGLFEAADWHVLHNALLPEARRDPVAQAPSRAAGGTFTFGYLGALMPTKGVEDIVAAFLALPASLPARLVLGGTGDAAYVARLQQMTAELPPGRVEWLGHVQREAVFSQAQVMIVASRWHEPQSLVIMEAATSGLPIFAARTGGTTEVVENSKIGLCFEAGNRAALSAMMREAAEGGVEAWRAQRDQRFPGLADFKGTAAATNFYGRLEQILHEAARKRP